MMSLTWMLAAFAGLALALPWLLQSYVERLPEAPACPSCRGITRQVDERLTSQMLTLFSTTGLRACGRCGWEGRMRWRWAANEVRSDR